MQTRARPSFHRRLLVQSGGTLIGALALLGLLAWFVAYSWINEMARLPLRTEIQLVASRIVQKGKLVVTAYYWDEPHHRLLERHVDPYFLQVFDARGRLVHQSENISRLSDRYPEVLLHPPVAHEPFWQPLRTFQVDTYRLYYLVYPLYDAEQRYLGAIQVARLEPGFISLYRQLGVGIFVIWLLLSGLILGTLSVTSRRVLRPLEQLAQKTAHLSADRLHEPIQLPEPLDRETAQLLEALNQLMRRLHQAFEELRRFTANAAHELKTPLAILQGQAELALRRPRSADSYRETLRKIRHQAEQMSVLVQHLLLLSRLDQPGTSFPFAPVDFAALVAREHEHFATRAADRGVALTASLTPDALLYGVETLLQEVVRNLLDNAVKYTPHGRIHVTVRKTKTQVIFEVQDTGVGIPRDALPHVTERFYRVPSTTTGIEGHGLGLTLVARIVALHRGQLTLEAEPGQGTTVRVVLPTGAVAAPEAPAPVSLDGNAR
ncbi:sensor histidine kinase [Rhodothermus profundi]|uniref:histidine kinase n=1 Tax=Rhodothermus profundi TaxID=633813 RepID=A0A1M6UJV6_9BACT|nr:HAMP domain-containing sensor histidine kinase [Rhodothermus profundi]SHK69456.1 Signal transduction histidine kinase [Rhodothermus profundi]